MSATSTASDARAQRYANWIGILALVTGVTMTGTLTFLASVVGWHGPMTRAATMAIGQLTAALSAYPYFEDVRQRNDMSPIAARSYIMRMAAIAFAVFVFMTLTAR